jgi:hypothetical protein
VWAEKRRELWVGTCGERSSPTPSNSDCPIRGST